MKNSRQQNRMQGQRQTRRPREQAGNPSGQSYQGSEGYWNQYDDFRTQGDRRWQSNQGNSSSFADDTNYGRGGQAFGTQGSVNPGMRGYWGDDYRRHPQGYQTEPWGGEELHGDEYDRHPSRAGLETDDGTQRHAGRTPEGPFWSSSSPNYERAERFDPERIPGNQYRTQYPSFGTNRTQHDEPAQWNSMQGSWPGYQSGYQGGYQAEQGARDAGQSMRGQESARQAGYRGRGPKGFERSDERLQEQISEKFFDDDRIDATDITVKVSKGEVTLEGTINSRQNKHAAEDLAESVYGVKEVINQLRVKKDSASSEGGSADSAVWQGGIKTNDLSRDNNFGSQKKRSGER